jgi:hypothetical protein
MQQATPDLVLRDIHVATAPPWWPPAPGWWILAGVALLVVASLLFLAWRRRHRRRAVARLFDAAVASAQTPPEQVAAMSELLRRAARRIDPEADRLRGDDWLAFLDRGLQQPAFVAGAGAVLRDGAFRRDLDDMEIAGLRSVVRARFLDWMGRKP